MCQRGASAQGWSNWTPVLENVGYLDKEHSQNTYGIPVSLLSPELDILVLLVPFYLRCHLGLGRCPSLLWGLSVIFLLLFLGGCSFGSNKLHLKKSCRWSRRILCHRCSVQHNAWRWRERKEIQTPLRFWCWMCLQSKLNCGIWSHYGWLQQENAYTKMTDFDFDFGVTTGWFCLLCSTLISPPVLNSSVKFSQDLRVPVRNAL